VPTLVPGSVVILDNATFHHGGRIADLIESAGCRLLYLPPYSPDLNRIEKCWAWLKSRIRKRLSSSAEGFDHLHYQLARVPIILLIKFALLEHAIPYQDNHVEGYGCR
jgi:transposase